MVANWSLLRDRSRRLPKRFSWGGEPVRFAVVQPRLSRLHVVVACLAAFLLGCGGCGHPTAAKRRGRTTSNASVSGQVTFLPHGIRTLAIGRLPNGQGFGIQAQRYEFQGRTHLALSAGIVPGAASTTAIEREFNSGNFGSGQFPIDQPSRMFVPAGLVGCSAHPVILIVGLLRDRTDTVELRLGGVSRALTRVSIPLDLHAGGDLVYGYLTTPATLIQRSSDGAVIESIDLGRPPAHKTCAGATTTVAYAIRKQP